MTLLFRRHLMPKLLASSLLSRAHSTATALVLCASTLVPTSAIAEQSDSKQKQQFSIPYIQQAPVLDGDVSDKLWQQAAHIPVNIVNYPYDNTPSPVQTDAYIYEDGENLYLAFIAKDPEPEKIQGFIKARDAAFADDIVGIKLDPFNDHRLAYKFFVNPNGVQNDGISNEMTGDENNLWDGLWDAYAKVSEDGYRVEMAIPYRELNFDESVDIKTWGFELIRIYPRDTILRISNMPIDKNNNCWACQMQEMVGFEQAKLGDNVLLTPSLVYGHESTRDIYQEQDWQTNKDVDLGLNLRWGITPDILLNATINPDFSTVEADAGQLTVNKTSALFFSEKRPFFLDNAEYFATPFDLVHTRNIVDPDWGAKLTGRNGQHAFAAFVSNDHSTSFILPGNLFSTVGNVNEQSFAGAVRYRYDVNDDLSFGALSTVRDSDSYHNSVMSFDSKYKLSPSNTIKAQFSGSQTKYPEEILADYCPNGQCYLASLVDVTNETFTDKAYLLEFDHQSEFWRFSSVYQHIGQKFRADLGFQPYSDFNRFSTKVNRMFFSENAWWSQAILGAKYDINHNDNGELISKASAVSGTIWGPWQSLFDIVITQEDKVGLRFDSNVQAIDGNTNLYHLYYADVYGELQPLPNLYAGVSLRIGDGVDNFNDRQGDIVELAPNIRWNISTHLEANVTYVYADLSVDGDYVYKQNIADLRMTYAFDVNNLLRLTLVYDSVQLNPDNNPNLYGSLDKEHNLSTELVYSYKLNPQTVFFLGYADNARKDGEISSLTRNQRNVFMKLSYAWL
ncbi:carbohydrate binding family 9 domain-containing protein [Thalassotalea maritima]|uniref:carbohydrate binding family 9 domain-containing protein n=1 Tax=Thalassotalea maritima TaxID=3242416 RepID=UPI003528B8BF